MADRVSQVGPSKWYWYWLDPADFAVQLGPSEDTGLSLIWKGGIEVNRLGECFKSCTRRIGLQTEGDLRVWMVIPDGPDTSIKYR